MTKINMTKIGIFFWFIFIFTLISCNFQRSENSNYFKISGKAQGTTYQIIYEDSLKRNFKSDIDSLFLRIDSSLSTYKANSMISKFNASDSGFFIDSLFYKMLLNSRYVYLIADSAFDPSINPVLTFWGFNKEKIENQNKISSNEIENLLKLKGFNLLQLDINGVSHIFENWPNTISTSPIFLKKPIGLFELNFNAIAQGFSVDLIDNFLTVHNIKNFMIEVGGEMKVKGQNAENKPWRLGVDYPSEDNTSRKLKSVISLQNGAVATSGNYRKFYIKDGVKYAHTINPKTGFPVKHSLLSATIKSKDCWLSDGLATACMVNGVEWSKQLPNKLNGVEVYLIWDESGELKTYQSNPEKWLLEEVN